MMRLIDCYLPVFRFVCDRLPEQHQDDTYENFRQEAIEVFEQSLAASRNLSISSDDVNDALFAMTVWFDEVVLRSALYFKVIWRSELLQSHYFDTVIGGEEFFTRLDSISNENFSLRAIYLKCLLLGFRGKFHYQDEGELLHYINLAKAGLPESWRVSPDLAEITPVNYSSRAVGQGVLRRFFNNKYSLLMMFIVEYFLLIGTLTLLS